MRHLVSDGIGYHPFTFAKLISFESPLDRRLAPGLRVRVIENALNLLGEIDLLEPVVHEPQNRQGTIMPTTIHARHGDLVIEKLSSPPSGDWIKATNYVVAGSHSSPHTVEGPVLYIKDGDVTNVHCPEDTRITHAGRHLEIPMPAGYYRFAPLRERGGEGDRNVED